MAGAPKPALPAGHTFTHDPSTDIYFHSIAEFLSIQKKDYDGICGSAIVHHPLTNRVLLVQRARHDSAPLQWEVPGGAIDHEDKTILHGTVRELFEESGLLGSRVSRQITAWNEDDEGEVKVKDVRALGGSVIPSRRRGLIFLFLGFEVEVDWEGMGYAKRVTEKEESWIWDEEKGRKEGWGVELDPEEHEDWVWASEEEIKAERMEDGKEIPLTGEFQRGIIMEMFRRKRKSGE